MLSPQILEALDITLWLGSGRHAVSLIRCDQSTISRQCQIACKTYILSNTSEAKHKPETNESNLSEWDKLLQQEGCVHQQTRILNGVKLRIHSNLLSSTNHDSRIWQGNLPFGQDCPAEKQLRKLWSTRVSRWQHRAILQIGGFLGDPALIYLLLTL